MSRPQIEQLLEECLVRFDSGATPEECLRAYPDRRAELEPLLRQALSLRVAYACEPKEEFRTALRERLMFAAGRDVSKAFAAEPDPRFVNLARHRFLQAAGAAAQEALRDVPPPRLAFWANARRRLLEAATLSGPRPANRGAGLALRAGLSAAVVVIAVAAAGFAFFANGPTPSADAQLAILEEKTQDLIRQAQAGGDFSEGELLELTSRTNALAERLDDTPSSPLTQRIDAVISKQREVLSRAAAAGAVSPPVLAQAQQQVNQAEEKLRSAPEQQPEKTAAPATSTATAAPDTPTPLPTATGTPSPSPTPVELEDGQVLVTRDPTDELYGIAWQDVRTTKVSLTAPASWTVVGVSLAPTGIGTLPSPHILGFNLGGPTNVVVLVYMDTGRVVSVINGKQEVLRDAGRNGRPQGAEEILKLTEGSGLADIDVLGLARFVNSVRVTD